jgi:hypothetical protein
MPPKSKKIAKSADMTEQEEAPEHAGSETGDEPPSLKRTRTDPPNGHPANELLPGGLTVLPPDLGSDAEEPPTRSPANIRVFERKSASAAQRPGFRSATPAGGHSTALSPPPTPGRAPLTPGRSQPTHHPSFQPNHTPAELCLLSQIKKAKDFFLHAGGILRSSNGQLSAPAASSAAFMLTHAETALDDATRQVRSMARSRQVASHVINI